MPLLLFSAQNDESPAERDIAGRGAPLASRSQYIGTCAGQGALLKIARNVGGLKHGAIHRSSLSGRQGVHMLVQAVDRAVDFRANQREGGHIGP